MPTQNTRDLAGRLLLQVTKLKDIVGRIVLQPLDRDAVTRLRLQVVGETEDLATRLRLLINKNRNIALRLNLLLNPVHDIFGRLNLGLDPGFGAQRKKDILGRFKLQPFQSPYGITEYIANKGVNTISTPQAVLTELEGWGIGMWIRPQIQWQSIELTPGVYTWTPLDNTVALCNAQGVNVCWNIQSRPLWYQKIDILTGANLSGKTSSSISSGVAITSIPVHALPTGTSIPSGYTMSVDAGGTNPETVTVDNNGPYVAGMTHIGILSWTPAYTHSAGSITIAINANPTTAPGLPNATDMATFAQQAAARYNGTSVNALTGLAQTPLYIAAIQIGNEEFDALGGPVHDPTNAYRDAMGKWLVGPLSAAYTAIKAVHPLCQVGANALCDVPGSMATHYTNWLNNLYTYNGGVGANCDWLDFHYYRGKRPEGPDPAIGGTSTPSISDAVTIIQAVPNSFGFFPEVWCNEFGWDLYDDGTCSLVPYVVSPTNYELYIKHMYDGMRLSGATRCLLFTLDPLNATVSTEVCSGVNTNWSTSPKSLSQTINGTLTLLQPYNDTGTGNGIAQYIATYPTWTAGAPPVFTLSPLALTPSSSGVTFNGTTYSASVVLGVTSGSTQSANWTATSSLAGVVFTPSSGTIAPGGNTTIAISAIPANGSGTFTFSGSEGESNAVTTWSNSGNTASGAGPKTQLVLVYNSTGQFLDVWRDAPLLTGFKEAINAATTPLTVTLPRSFDNYDLIGQPGSRGTVAQGNVVKYYLFGQGLPAAGLLRYQGVIDAFQPQIDDNGKESIVVTLVPFSSIIADHGIGGGQGFGQPGVPSTYVDPISMFNFWFNAVDFITGKTYMSPLTLDPTNPTSSGVSVSYAFLNQNIQSVFNTILLMLPANWFYRINPDNSVTLNVAPTIAQHTFNVGQHIAAPTYKQDWTALKNVIYGKGGGTLVSIKKGSDVAIFGERLQLFSETRATDQTTLDTLTQGYLTALDLMQLRTTIRVLDYRGDNQTGLGVDIEQIKVGDTCIIQDPTFALTNAYATPLWGTAKWNEDYWLYTPTASLTQVAVITTLTYGFDYVDLELTNLQPSQDVALSRIRQQFQDWTMGPGNTLGSSSGG